MESRTRKQRYITKNTITTSCPSSCPNRRAGIKPKFFRGGHPPHHNWLAWDHDNKAVLNSELNTSGQLSVVIILPIPVVKSEVLWGWPPPPQMNGAKRRISHLISEKGPSFPNPIPMSTHTVSTPPKRLDTARGNNSHAVLITFSNHYKAADNFLLVGGGSVNAWKFASRDQPPPLLWSG